MRLLGHVLLWGGFLGGSFVAVRTGTTPDLRLYLALLAVAASGVVLLRLTARAALGHAPKVAADLTRMRESLDRLSSAIGRLLAAREEIDVYDVHERLDAELLEDLVRFAEARESMIPAFGLEGYAEVMTDFAGAERLINRAWSASADGYADEVWSVLEQAARLMRRARDRFAARS